MRTLLAIAAFAIVLWLATRSRRETVLIVATPDATPDATPESDAISFANPALRAPLATSPLSGTTRPIGGGSGTGTKVDV